MCLPQFTVRYTLALILSFITTIVFSQTSVKGIVINADNSEGLPGVTVLIKGTQVGTVTDYQSTFSISHSEAIKFLEFSYVGYETQTVEINGDDYITVKLKPASLLIDQVVITAAREEQSRNNVAVAMSTISSKKVGELKAESAGQLLNKISSVHVADFGNEQQSISIRNPLSFGRTYLVILEDGIPIAPTSITTSGDVKEINLANIRSVEVLRGPTSSMYGSEAVGGVVNFVTQRPSLTPTLSAGYQGSQFGYSRGDLAMSNTFGKVGVRVNGYYAQRENGYRDHTDYSKLALSGRVDYQLGSKTKWISTISYVDFYTDFAGSLDSTQFYTNDTYNNYHINYANLQSLRVRTTLNHYWNKNSKSFLTLFHRNYEGEELPTYRIKTIYGMQPKYWGELVKHGFTSYGGIAQHVQKFDFMNAKLIGGVSFDYSPNNYMSDSIGVTKTEGYYTDYEKTGTYVQDFYSQLFNSAAYLQGEIEPLKGLNIQAALRYDQLFYKYDNHLPPSATSGSPDEENTFSHLSPKIGLTYAVRKNLTVYGNYSVGFAPPMFTQLYKQVKVPVLIPATFYSYEAGFWAKLYKDKVYGEFTVYKSDGRNEIVEVLLSDNSTQNQSVGKTLHQGIEYSITMKPISCVELRFTGSNSFHQYVEFVDASNDYSGNEMSHAPEFVGHASIGFRPEKKLKGLRVEFELQKVGAYYIDQLNTEEYEGYAIVNARAGYRIKGFELWMNVMNIADNQFASRVSKSTYGSPMNPIVVYSYSPGFHRTIQFGLSYHFAK